MLTGAAARRPKPSYLASPGVLVELEGFSGRQLRVLEWDAEPLFGQLKMCEYLLEFMERPGVFISELKDGSIDCRQRSSARQCSPGACEHGEGQWDLVRHRMVLRASWCILVCGGLGEEIMLSEGACLCNRRHIFLNALDVVPVF